MADSTRVLVDLASSDKPLSLVIHWSNRFANDALLRGSGQCTLDNITATSASSNVPINPTQLMLEFNDAARAVSLPGSSLLADLAGYLGFAVGVTVLAVMAVYAFVVFWRMLRGPIDLEYLISEPDGKASISRFQFLVFTFVVAGSLLAITLSRGAFPSEIPSTVLWLLGISAASYVGGKAVQVLGGAGTAAAASGPASGTLLPFVKGDTTAGAPTVPGWASVDGTGTTARTFRMMSGVRDWSPWMELTGFVGVVSFTVNVAQIRTGELDGEVRYTGPNGAVTVALVPNAVTTFKTDNLIGTVEIRFKGIPAAVEVTGTIAP